MAKKPKVIHTVKSIIINCSAHGTFLVPVDECTFTGGEAECELCGSHGSVDVTVECPGCLIDLKPKQRHQAKITIELNSW